MTDQNYDKWKLSEPIHENNDIVIGYRCPLCYSVYDENNIELRHNDYDDYEHMDSPCLICLEYDSINS